MMNRVHAMNTKNDELFLSSGRYLKAIICNVLEKPVDALDAETPFGDYGIDSFLVLRIVKRLESDFGRLPKTLLFEYINLSELAVYFVSEHKEKLLGKLEEFEGVKDVNRLHSEIDYEITTQLSSISEVNHISHSKDLDAPILVNSTDLDNNVELKKIVHELYRVNKNEGSVSRGTREIAPMIFWGQTGAVTLIWVKRTILFLHILIQEMMNTLNLQ